MRLSYPLHLFAKNIFILLYRIVYKIKDRNIRNNLYSKILRWRKSIYPSGEKVMSITKLDKDLSLWVNLCELEGGNLYFDVEFEPFEIKIVKKLVKSGNVFFDVGANIGIYTLITSKLVGKKGIVHAFEPASFAYKILLKNIHLNKMSNIIPNRLAISDTIGEVELFVNQESGLTSLGETYRGKIFKREIVKSITIDKYIALNNIKKVNFLKIDVEGFEGHVLKGAKKLIEDEKDLIILCELAKKNMIH